MTTVVSEINRHIGRRLRALRVMGGMSQAGLGEILSLTFQQVQKYEKGYNKISAEKLWIVAEHFGVELDYFVQGMDDAYVEPSAEGGDPPARDPAFRSDRLRLETARALRAISSTKVLRNLLSLIRSIGGDDEPAPPDETGGRSRRR